MCLCNSQDTDALVEAIESGNVEVNFMDDVGQTLLNWASAFGTQEMVEFLCRKGADVNKGHRSSSLHYAACFGRPQIARVLLRFGANPDLRDEDGKTPLDKARERNDEGHREVANILQSPADWLTVANANDEADEDEAGVDDDREIEVEVAAEVAAAAAMAAAEVEAVSAGAQATSTTEVTPAEAAESAKKQDLPTKRTEQPDPPQGPKGDPEMIPVYARSLLPMFCHTFQSSMIATVKKSSLGLIKKIVHYMEPALLEEVCGANRHLVGEFVEVLTSVLDNEEDEEGHLTCLLIIQDLMVKDGEGLFLEHFAKLGLYSKVHSLAEDTAESPDLAESPEAGSSSSQQSQGEILPPPAQEDAKEIVQGRAYTWRDWSLARGRDCLYIWSDAAALELSNGSNGWFRFILDGKLATMYSSGSPEGGSDSSENRGEFLEKLQRARAAVTASAIDAAAAAASAASSDPAAASAAAAAATAAASASVATPVFTKKSPDVIAVGNWNLSCSTEGELNIINSDGQQQATILREDLPGFLFQSNRGTRHTFTAETSLGPEFSAGWISGSGARGKSKGRLKGKIEAVKQRVKSTAKLIYENYFRVAQATPRGVVATLANIVTKIDTNCQKQLVR